MSEQEVCAQVKENGDVVMYYFGKRVRIKAGVMKYMTLEERTVAPPSPLVHLFGEGGTIVRSLYE